jgi:hypothetical protein
VQLLELLLDGGLSPVAVQLEALLHRHLCEDKPEHCSLGGVGGPISFAMVKCPVVALRGFRVFKFGIEIGVATPAVVR